MSHPMHPHSEPPQHDAHVREHDLYLKDVESARRHALLLRNDTRILQLASCIRLEIYEGVMTVFLDAFAISAYGDQTAIRRIMESEPSLPTEAVEVVFVHTPTLPQAQKELF